MALMNFSAPYQIAVYANPEAESLDSLHVIYCGILYAVETKKMELRRPPGSDLRILSTVSCLMGGNRPGSWNLFFLCILTNPSSSIRITLKLGEVGRFLCKSLTSMTAF